jgi:hypothetical protein
MNRLRVSMMCQVIGIVRPHCKDRSPEHRTAIVFNTSTATLPLEKPVEQSSDPTEVKLLVRPLPSFLHV